MAGAACDHRRSGGADVTTGLRCPVCEGCRARVVLVRDRVPVFLNRVYESPEQARLATAGRIELASCPSCGFTFNAAFNPGLTQYGPDYENDQSHSHLFAAHLQEMAARIQDRLGEAGGLVVEVGCGQGDLLGRLVRMGSAGRIAGVGFDPAFRGGAAPTDAAVTCYATIFSKATRHLLPKAPDVLVSRHVIEHVPDPVGFLRSCVDALPTGRQVSVFLETPSLEWILENVVFFDVFYEHCCYFSKTALIVAASRGGLSVRSVQRVFGGQYYFLEAAIGSNAPPQDVPKIVTEVERFATAELEARQYWQTRIAEAKSRGAVAVWGAGAKGVTFINLLDPDCELVQSLIDVNPRKQGRFAPLTAHPIYSLDVALESGVKTAFLMNPNYLNEVRDMVRHANGKMEVVSVEGWNHAVHI